VTIEVAIELEAFRIQAYMLHCIFIARQPLLLFLELALPFMLACADVGLLTLISVASPCVTT
jgi:hypothetical protein